MNNPLTTLDEWDDDVRRRYPEDGSDGFRDYGESLSQPDAAEKLGLTCGVTSNSRDGSSLDHRSYRSC